MIRRRIFRPFNVLLTLFACQRHFTCRYSDAILSVKSLAAAVRACTHALRYWFLSARLAYHGVIRRSCTSFTHEVVRSWLNGHTTETRKFAVRAWHSNETCPGNCIVIKMLSSSNRFATGRHGLNVAVVRDRQTDPQRDAVQNSIRPLVVPGACVEYRTFSPRTYSHPSGHFPHPDNFPTHLGHSFGQFRLLKRKFDKCIPDPIRSTAINFVHVNGIDHFMS